MKVNHTLLTLIIIQIKYLVKGVFGFTLRPRSQRRLVRNYARLRLGWGWGMEGGIDFN